MKKTLVLLALLFSNFIYCQYEAVDNKMNEIPKEFEKTTDKIANFIIQNFTSENDKIRAAFYWTASRINYDVDNMFNQKPQTSEEKIATTLNTKKGVCMHYSEVFNDICNKIGVKSCLVDGYTKQNGEIAKISHVWNVCKIDGKWYLFDTTWAAGYVNGNAYYKKFNNAFYKSNVENFLKTHMPFDYMWQLNEKPITNDEFYKDITQSNLIANQYDFNSEIILFEKMSNLEKIQKRIERLEKSGIKNRFITEANNILKKGLENNKNNSSITKIELIVSEYNEANRLMNLFIQYKNSKFNPMVSDEEIKEKIQIPCDKLKFCQDEISQIVNISRENSANLNALKRTLADAKKRFDLHLNFVNEYLSKTTLERQSFFNSKKK